VVLAAAAAVFWLRQGAPPAPLPVVQTPAAAPAPSAPASAASVVAALPASAPAEVIEAPAPAAAMTAADIEPSLAELFGQKAVSTLLLSDDFAHRLVATVDNLARQHAPSILWPVNRADGRFTVEDTAGGPVISADNAQRYTPLVLLVESVDPGRAAALYARMRPLLQQAYHELGYPNGNFDERVLEVIDVLLAAPTVKYPVKLKLTEIKGPIASQRPWVHYEFADAELEARPAGQKIMMRVGVVNERRLKARLREFRHQLLRQMPAR
jgi:hypothetical protein